MNLVPPALTLPSAIFSRSLVFFSSSSRSALSNWAMASSCCAARERSIGDRPAADKGGAAAARAALHHSAEPGHRQARGHDHQQRGGGGEQAADLGLFLLDDEPRAERLVDLLEIVGGAGVEVLGAREIGDLLERVFVEPH